MAILNFVPKKNRGPNWNTRMFRKSASSMLVGFYYIDIATSLKGKPLLTWLRNEKHFKKSIDLFK